MKLEEMRRKVWERDRYRCQECGIQVGRGPGLRPHTHHVVPKWLGGSDEERNLRTLCQPCHTAKADHRFMLAKVPIEDYPQYIKQSIWEISLNLLAYADVLNPRQFPDRDEVIEHIKKVKQSLEVVQELAKECGQEGKGKVPEDNGQTRQVEDVIEGIRIAWSRDNRRRGMIWKRAKTRPYRKGA